MYRLNPNDIKMLPEWVQVFATSGDCDLAVGMLLEVSEGTLRQIYEQRGKRKAGWLANKWLNKGLKFIREDLQSLTDPILRATYRGVVAQFSYCLLPKNRSKVLTALGIDTRRGEVNQIIVDLMEEEENAAIQFAEEKNLPVLRERKKLPMIRPSIYPVTSRPDYSPMPYISMQNIECPYYVAMIESNQYYLSDIIGNILEVDGQDLIARNLVQNRPPQIDTELARQVVAQISMDMFDMLDAYGASASESQLNGMMLDCMTPISNWWNSIGSLVPQIQTREPQGRLPRPISITVPLPSDIAPTVTSQTSRPIPAGVPPMKYPIRDVYPPDEDPYYEDDDLSLPIPPLSSRIPTGSLPPNGAYPPSRPTPPLAYPFSHTSVSPSPLPLPDPDIVARHPDLIDCDCDFAIRYIIRELDILRRRGRISSTEYRRLYDLYQMYVTMSRYTPSP